MEEKNVNARLETFCDGVFAIALTLLIIDIRLPSAEKIDTTAEFWLALSHLAPSIFAFLLSFIVIFITWVNHHRTLTFVHKSSPHFIFANGFLLLTVVFVPFPTSLIGEFVLTDRAGPAVALYSAVFTLQAISWILLCSTALNPADPLTISEKARLRVRENLQRGYSATALYALCTIAAFWFPLTIAVVLALTWVVWLIVGMNAKAE